MTKAKEAQPYQLHFRAIDPASAIQTRLMRIMAASHKEAERLGRDIANEPGNYGFFHFVKAEPIDGG